MALGCGIAGREGKLCPQMKAKRRCSELPLLMLVSFHSLVTAFYYELELGVRSSTMIFNARLEGIRQVLLTAEARYRKEEYRTGAKGV
jgi:hypothetical protein